MVSVTAPAGFQASGVACGIKQGGHADLALVVTADRAPVVSAGVFTDNRVQAAPVQVSRRHLHDGQATAVVLNSGNANAATGDQGLADAEQTCRATADALGCDAGDVLVCSTGLIGFTLPMDRVSPGIAAAAAALDSDEAAGLRAAEAILTTDTRAKEARARCSLPGEDGTVAEVTVGAMAKGAAMLAPSMATMLALVTTDAAVEATALAATLDYAVDASFHALSVDGCTSTNDTVLVLAGGQAGNEPVERGSKAFHDLNAALTSVLRELAEEMASDAEGATKLARIHVRNARSDEEARRAARQVANSLLVKCSLYGQDPYWGRVLSELGASGVTLEPDRVSIAYNGVAACVDGVAAATDRDALAAAMEPREIEIDCDLALGTGTATVMTSDLTHAYVDENMGTS